MQIDNGITGGQTARHPHFKIPQGSPFEQFPITAWVGRFSLTHPGCACPSERPQRHVRLEVEFSRLRPLLASAVSHQG
jgi:hypothetical protein